MNVCIRVNVQVQIALAREDALAIELEFKFEIQELQFDTALLVDGVFAYCCVDVHSGKNHELRYLFPEPVCYVYDRNRALDGVSDAVSVRWCVCVCVCVCVCARACVCV